METLEIGQRVRIEAIGVVKKISIDGNSEITYEIRFPKDGEQGYFKLGHGYANVDSKIVSLVEGA